VDVVGRVLEVDVGAVERAELSGSLVRVDGQGEETAPAQRYSRARDQREKLARPKVHLGLVGPLVGCGNAVGRVVVSNAEVNALGLTRVPE
jgi:hypothetical protein